MGIEMNFQHTREGTALCCTVFTSFNFLTKHTTKCVTSSDTIYNGNDSPIIYCILLCEWLLQSRWQYHTPLWLCSIPLQCSNCFDIGLMIFIHAWNILMVLVITDRQPCFFLIFCINIILIKLSWGEEWRSMVGGFDSLPLLGFYFWS